MRSLFDMSHSQPPTLWPDKLAVSIALGMALFVPLSLMGVEQPAVPQTQSGVPQTQSAVPQTQSAVPQTQSAVPQTQSAVPQTETIIESPPQSGIPQTQVMDSFDTMQAPRDYVSGKVTSFASYIDRFFGGDRHYQESNPSVFQMDLSRAAGYGGGRRFELDARLNLRLPITEGKISWKE